MNLLLLSLRGLKAGYGCVIAQGCSIEPKKVTLGNKVAIGVHCIIHGDVTIGDNTLIAQGVTIVTGTHDYTHNPDMWTNSVMKPIKIGCDCWIGAGAIILGGVSIGDGTIVGAGSVVNKDLPDNVVAVGVPARVIKERPKIRPVLQCPRMIAQKIRQLEIYDLIKSK